MNIATFLDKAPRYILYGILLFLPVFFLPFTSFQTDFNKQIFFSVALFSATLLFIANALRAGSLSIKTHLLFAPVLFLIAVLGISTYGSGAITHSFWGSQVEPDSFFNLILFALFFALLVFLFEGREHAANAIYFFIAGAVLDSLFVFAHSFSPALLPLGFTQSAAFNPFGSFYAFSLYAGAAFAAGLALLAANMTKAQKKGVAIKKTGFITPRTLFLGLALALLFFIELGVNFPIAWFALAVCSLVIVYSFVHELPRGRMGFIALPLFVLACSFTFLFIRGIPFVGFLKAPVEVRLTHQATFNILEKTLRRSPKNLLFGSGPATFVNQYNLHRDGTANNSPFWDVHFSQGVGAFLSFFAAFGVLGGVLFVLFSGLFTVYGARWLLFRKSKSKGKEEDHQSFELLAIFAGGLCFLIAWLFYTAQFLLLFGGFAMIALWVAIMGKKKEIQFVKSPQGTFWGMSGGVTLVVGLIFIFYTIGKNYYAELFFTRGAVYANNGDLERGIPYLEKAAQLHRLDRYWRNLSNARLLYIGSLLRNSSLQDTQKRDLIQKNMLISESQAKEAIKINPNNVDNVLQIADFYASIAPISEGAFDFAVQNYSRAKNFDPENPSIPAKLGFVYLRKAEVLKTKAEGDAYKVALEKARQEGEAALTLKADFAPAKDLLYRIQQLQ
ncbi:MAG: hypothetical protein HYS15_02845 [Candidatus Spechtbacteria bacterium]|nr:hypothetical protein [Candidatus Spechtbacteria bacterium]